MPVPFLFTATWSQLGQVWVALEMSSTSATRFLMNLPYRQPNLPALLDIRPFDFFCLVVLI
jgi:hypothetical protein